MQTDQEKVAYAMQVFDNSTFTNVHAERVKVSTLTEEISSFGFEYLTQIQSMEHARGVIRNMMFFSRDGILLIAPYQIYSPTRVSRSSLRAAYNVCSPVSLGGDMLCYFKPKSEMLSAISIKSIENMIVSQDNLGNGLVLEHWIFPPYEDVLEGVKKCVDFTGEDHFLPVLEKFPNFWDKTSQKNELFELR